jgi:hypothetical protein
VRPATRNNSWTRPDQRRGSDDGRDLAGGSDVAARAWLERGVDR